MAWWTGTVSPGWPPASATSSGRDAAPGSPEWNIRADVVARAMRLIADGVVDRDGIAGLASGLGYEQRQGRRPRLARVEHPGRCGGPRDAADRRWRGGQGRYRRAGLRPRLRAAAGTPPPARPSGTSGPMWWPARCG